MYLWNFSFVGKTVVHLLHTIKYGQSYNLQTIQRELGCRVHINEHATTSEIIRFERKKNLYHAYLWCLEHLQQFPKN
jgi:hypothetical protein